MIAPASPMVPSGRFSHVPDTVVVVAAGAPAEAVAVIPAGSAVIAADGGAVPARAFGLGVELVVGDLDSLGAMEVEELERAGVPIRKYPREKDASDLELALAAALELGPRRVLVLGSAGGRLDQLVGLALLLGAEPYAGVEIDARLGEATLQLVRRERELEGSKGELLSLFALHGAARDVTTEGLAYPLRGETLVPGSTRGLSNRFSATRARITVGSGVLLAVRPGSG
jgi:thiamine pyrophosphokinase